MPLNLLITGFEPFGGRDVNLSWEVAREAASSAEPAGSVRAVRLPVSFEEAPVALREAIDGIRPDAVLMLGFSAKRAKINVERVAINLMDAKIPDNDAVRPTDMPVEENAPAAIFATLPPKRLLAAIRDAGVDADLSCSAGTYVCNTAFYTALRCLDGTGTPVGFIHLPDMDFEDAMKAVCAAMKAINVIRNEQQ